MPDGDNQNDLAERRLGLIRADIDVQLAIVAAHLECAHIYVGIGHDEGIERAMNDAKDRMRALLSLTARLMQERRDAALNAEAAMEWRAQREARGARKTA